MGASLCGVLELNALFTVAGASLLWGLRGYRSLLELVELLGLALVVGLASVSTLATLVLVAGGGLSFATIGGLLGGVFAIGCLLGLALGRSLPRGFGHIAFSLGTAVAGLAAAAALVVVVELFRLARVEPIGGVDGWLFWVPKAKIIYFRGGIDSPLFTTLQGENFPLLVPALFAMDFRFMGSAFTPELAVQYAILYAAFVLAAAAILRRLVPAWLGWVFVALTAVIPQLDDRVLDAQADWTVDLMLGLCALVCISWLRSGGGWQLAVLAVLLAALLETKLEGLVFAASLGAGVAASSWRSHRRVWLPLALLGIGAVAVTIPWDLWWRARHLQSSLPANGGLSTIVTHFSRLWPSLDLVLRLVFSTGRWLWLVPIALVASVACLRLGAAARETAVIYLVTFVLCLADFTWYLWANPGITLNELQVSTAVPRLAGSVVILSTVLAPLLIEPLLPRGLSRSRGRWVVGAARADPDDGA